MKPAFTLPSPETKTNYAIFADAKSKVTEGRLLLVLDGDDQFAPACEVIREKRLRDKLPPLLPIGIGYGGSYRSPLNRRARDYTPTASNDEPSETGGAAEFLQFIERTLLPALATRYRFPTDDIAIGGHSLGSLFVLYALAKRPKLFRHYLVSSPSIWWDERSVLPLVKRAARTRVASRRAFFSVGTKDTESMRGDLALLQEQFRTSPLPWLDYVFKKFPGKDHYNVLPTAYAVGLEWLYAP